MKKRLLSMFTTFLMVCSIIMYLPNGIIASADSFTPRTTAPSTSNSYFYSDNPFYQGGYGMPNCTCYAYGRAWEILGSKPNLSTGNAGKWYWYNKNNGIYSYGSTPKLGAIACWDKYDQNQGHVAVVEAINGDTITISESHYKSTNFDTREITSNSSNYLTSMRFCGYIYIGDFNQERIDTPIDNSYKVPCERIASKKYDVYDVYGNPEYNPNGVKRYIAQNDECTIHEVYGSGYVKVTYPVGNSTHTAYAKNDGWGLDPVTPIIRSFTADKEWYAVGDNLNFSFEGSNYTELWIRIEKYETKDPIIVLTEMIPSSYTLSADRLGAGDYAAYITVCNQAGTVDTGRVWFNIAYPKPTFSILSANKYNYALGEDIVFTANSDNNAKFTIGINNENGDRLITRDLPGTLTVSSKELGLGAYYAYVTAYNSAGYVDSSGIWFLVSPQGAAMSSGAGQTIPNGDYVITSEMSQDLYLDIPGTAIPGENNLVVSINDGHPGKGAEYDVWTVTYLNNGFYKITQKDTNMALDLYDDSLNRGTRTTVRAYSGSASQQWSINATDHGYQIQSRSTGWVLDVVGGNATPGTQTNVWEINDNAAQSWGFVPFASDDRPIADGEYSIKSKLANVWLDVWGNYDVEPYQNGTNIGICNAITDTFDVKYIGDGYYKILEHNSGLALDVDKPSYLNRGGNVQLYENGSNDKANQLWRIKDMGNGYYCLISKMSGYCIDIAGAVVDNSTNVQQYTFNNHDAQKWSFEKVHKHSYTSKITKSATCTEDGVKTYTCECGDTYTEKIPAIGHKWNAATYTWSADNKTCTATRVCANDSSHKETEKVSTTYTVTKQPTKTEKGIGTYTATFKNTAFVEQTHNVDIPPLSDNKHPVVTSEVQGRQFRLKWTSVPDATKYGLAVYQSGKWRVKVQFKANVTTYTSPKMKTGSYKMVVCAKVNGEWDTSSLSKRAFTVKIA